MNYRNGRGQRSALEQIEESTGSQKLTWTFLGLAVACFVIPTLHAQAGVHFNHEFAPTDSFVKGPELEHRADISLNGMWEFQPAPLPSGFHEGSDPPPALPAPDPGRWEKTRIRIPSPWNANSFANQNGEGGDFRTFPSYPAAWEKAEMGWLRRTVDVPDKWSGNRILLHFAAAAGDLTILVNGKPAASKLDIFFPFDVDVTDLIRPGTSNEILVGVRKASLFDQKGKYGRRIYQAGSFWGQHVVGLWQDVDLVSVPSVHVSDVFVESQVDHNTLVARVTLRNDTGEAQSVSLDGDIRAWKSIAPDTGPDAADPRWTLATSPVLEVAAKTATVAAHSTAVVELRQPVEGKLNLWSPDSPSLYGLTVHLSQDGKLTDAKYQRFGWRQFQLKGSELLLNGKPIKLRGDSWHFLGIPQMSRRYARAWFSTMRSANLNAVRLHAQPYPEFYLDVADEMGIVVLDETAIWASDGGPKLDSTAFWEDTKSHVAQLVLRDRNHPSVMGWSVCNEMKPIVQSVFHNPPGMYDVLLEYYAVWRKICEELDPTRPWISADGDDDGNGRLPVYIVHYGGNPAIERAAKTGKPWGVGEAGGAYYATPEQVAKSYGDAAYASFEQRGRGIANDSFKTLAFERKLHADYQSIFNMVWYGLKPLPIGMSDTTRTPQLTDGVFFPDFVEGKPGVQPERLGPYSTTLNPGYDPELPEFQPMPLYYAIQAAGAEKLEDFFDAPPTALASPPPPAAKLSGIAVLSASPTSFAEKIRDAGISPSEDQQANLLLVDGANPPAPSARARIDQVLRNGGTVVVWGIDGAATATLNPLLPADLVVTARKSSSLMLGKPASATYGLTLASLYFSELSPPTFVTYGLSGPMVTQSNTLLSMSDTEWTKWNKQPEYAKTAMVIRSELEAKGAGAVLIEARVGNGRLLATTLPVWSSQFKVQTLIRTLLGNIGVPLAKEVDLGQPFLTTGILGRTLAAGHFSLSDTDVDATSKNNIKENDRAGALRWNLLTADNGKFDLNQGTAGNGNASGVEYLSVWIQSPRPLDNLLLEPNVPRVSTELTTDDEVELYLNGISFYKKDVGTSVGVTPPLPLQQGWNHILIRLKRAAAAETFGARLLSSDPAFLTQLTSALQRP